jgi:hypothetical protein
MITYGDAKKKKKKNIKRRSATYPLSNRLRLFSLLPITFRST